MTDRQQQYTWRRFGATFAGGYVGLSLAFAVMHPIDTLKTQLQASASNLHNTTAYTRAAATNWRSVMRQLSRGFWASVLGAGPQGAARLSTYEMVKFQLADPRYGLLGQQYYMLSVVTAAVLGDFASSIVKVPREVLTSRLQTLSIGNSGSAALTTWDVVKVIYRRDGARGFFRGFWSTTARDCPFMMILFSSYESMKSNIMHLPFVGDSDGRGRVGMGLSTLCGGVSGGMAGFVTTPFDVIKTRIMTAGSSVPEIQTKRHAKNVDSKHHQRSIKQLPKRPQVVHARSVSTSVSASSPPTMYTTAQQIYTQYGLRGFFIGALPRSAWWFCVCSIFFPTYEVTKSFIWTGK